MTFEPTTTREEVERKKHLRVERLVKIQTRDCQTCGEPVVWADTGNGKRLPFEPHKLLSNSIKVVIDHNEGLGVWPFAPRKHVCSSEKVLQNERSHRAFRPSGMGLDSYEPPDPVSPWGDRW